MKSTLSIIIVCLISALSIAQNGINYKALIKDANGDVVANQAITAQFQILEGTTLPGGTATVVYQETHNPTTDANGIIIVNIGDGTVNNGDFTTINWGIEEHFLNVQVDTGSGLVDLGTTQFSAVPYAIMADSVKNTPVSGFALVKARGTGFGNGKLRFGFEDFDLTNNFEHDPSAIFLPELSRFTATEAGYYSIKTNGTGSHMNSNEFFIIRLSIEINGTAIKRSEYVTWSQTGGQNKMTIAVTTIAYLVPGDYIEISGNTTFGTQTYSTELQIERIR